MKDNKQYTIVITLLIILLVAIIGLLGVARYNYVVDKQKEEQLKEEQKAQIGRLLNDMNNEYQLFKNIAPWWNQDFAKLTLNHTRDTVEHKDYSLEDFSKLHTSIMSSITFIKTNSAYENRMHISQLPSFISADFNLQKIMGTFRIRDSFFSDAEKLNNVYYSVCNTVSKSELIKPNYVSKQSMLYNYFNVLKKMDQTLYNLLSYQYPDDLAFLVNKYPDYISNAKDRLLGKHINKVYNAYFNYIENPEEIIKGVQILPNIIEGDTLVSVFTMFKNQEKTLVSVYTEKELFPLAEDKRLAFLEQIDTFLPKNEKEEKRYYVVNSKDGFYYATDSNKKLYPHVLEGDDTEVLQFYDDYSKRYYIVGDYSPFHVYYPGEENK